MGGEAQEVNRSWLNPERLIDFIDELREAGYNIGISQYVAAQDLILALMARGESLDPPHRFKSLLGPILCSSPSEQDDFPQRFDRWVERIGLADVTVAPKAKKPEGFGRELEDIERRSRRWGAVLVAIGLLVLAGLIFYLSQGVPEDMWGAIFPGRPPVSQAEVLEHNGATPGFDWWIVVALTLLLLCPLIIWRLWWRQRANQFLIRRATNRQPEIQRVSVSGLDDNIFPALPVFRLAQDLRRRIEAPSTRLDVDKTITKTVNSAGWFTPVFGYLQVPPEYLFMVDRTGYGDHQARLVDTLVRRLKENEVFATVYYYDGDPRICFPAAGNGPPLSLWELAAKYDQHRLVLFSDASGLFSARTGELEAWTEYFEVWADRAVVTPEPAENWGYREQELSQQFIVVPATIEGLAALARTINYGEAGYEAIASPKASLPVALRTRPRRWIERDPPEPALIDDVLTSLRRYLGEAGYYWLSACAVYPALHWDLTIYLGNALWTEDGRQVLQASQHLDLVRLPWFRHGFMPDWLRIRLISELTEQQEESVRSALAALLVTAVQGPVDSFQLEIAREHRGSLSALAKPLLRLLAKEAPGDSALKDYVFQSFMTGREPGRLAVRLPEPVRDLIGAPAPGILPKRRRRKPWIVEMLTIWVRVLTMPAEWVFKEEIQKPNATLRTAMTFIIISSAIGWGLIFASEMALIFSDIVVFLMMSLIVLPTIPILFLAYTGFYFLIARLLGGDGEFGRYAYLLATFVAPFWIVMATLALLNTVTGTPSLLPLFSSCVGPILWLYGIRLRYFATRVAHGLAPGRALVVTLSPIFLLILLVVDGIIILLLVALVSA
jgi:hypothetical protein